MLRVIRIIHQTLVLVVLHLQQKKKEKDNVYESYLFYASYMSINGEPKS